MNPDQLAADVYSLLTSTARTASERWPILDRDDVLSELHEIVVRALPKYDPSRGAAFSTFLYPALQGAVVRLLKQRIQEHHRHSDHTEVDDLDPSEVLGEMGLDPFDQTHHHQRQEIIELLLGATKLDLATRHSIHLHFWQDLRVADVARTLGDHDATVDRRIRAGIDRLRETLSRLP